VRLVISTWKLLSFLGLGSIIRLLERSFFITLALINLRTTFIVISSPLTFIKLIILFLLVCQACDSRFLTSLPFIFICYVEEM
jgi:hypothetical protein